MQKFLIGTGIGGAALSFGALCYLIKTCGEGLDPIYRVLSRNPALQNQILATKDGVVGFLGDCYSPLLTAWWKHYRDMHHSEKDFKFEGNVFPESEISFLHGDAGELRDMAIPFIERLEGVYAEFDEANNGTPMRVVEVPDGYFCGIMEDPETGIECVEEYPQTWQSMSDEEYRCLAAIRKFAGREADDGSWYKDDTVYEIGRDVRIAFHGNVALAYCSDMGDDEPKYVFLRKNEYYIATKDHPKVVFEVQGIQRSKLIFNTVFHDASDFEGYAYLMQIVKKEST